MLVEATEIGISYGRKFWSTEMPRWNSTSKSPAKTDDVGCDSGPTGSRDWCILRQGWSGCTPILSWQTYDVVVDFAANAALFVVGATPGDKSFLKWGTPRTYIPKWYRKISQKGGKVRSHRHFDKLYTFLYIPIYDKWTHLSHSKRHLTKLEHNSFGRNRHLLTINLPKHHFWWWSLWGHYIL